MKRIAGILLILVLITGILPLSTVFAREGDSGYEGGISSGYNAGKTVDYQEVCFISGEPIVLNGTLTITKQFKQNAITSTYKYSLKNADKAATLSRTLVFNTTLSNKDNGQMVEDTALSKPPAETFKLGSTSYVLQSGQSGTSDFTRSSLVDPKPAINYYAGNLLGKKVYSIGTNSAGGTVTVETTGNYYGYDQYWGSSEVEVLDLMIDSEKNINGKPDKWGGTARLTLSSTVTNQLKFYKNQPDQISFDGGYVQTQYNNSVLKYESTMPEFDSKGVSTDMMLNKSGSMEKETFPTQKRLLAVNISSIRGHWAEQDIDLMYSLEIFQGNNRDIKPDQYITKAEFALAIVQAAKEVPPDPAQNKKTPTATMGNNNKKTILVSPFDDVSIDNKYFSSIKSAYDRGLLSGKGNNLFGPNDSITVAEAVTVFIRATGLEAMASSSDAVTTFRDNDLIPDYARNAAYVAQKIGLVQGDNKGNLNPGKKLTKAEAATMLGRLIVYLQDGIKNDYRDGILNY